MRVRLEDLSARYQEQARAQLADRATVRPAKQKRNGKKALDTKKAFPKMDTPVHIVITIYKIGDGWDVDNREIKGILDSLTAEGIIEDDCIRVIPQITKKGVRVKTKAEEKTIIEIMEVEDGTRDLHRHG